MMKMPMWARGVAVGVLLSGLAAHGALADDAKAGASDAKVPGLGKIDPNADQFITLTSENDKYFGDTDRHYTNGAQATYTVLKDQPSDWVNWVGDKLPFLNVGGRTAMNYSFGQQIFTPDHVQSYSPQIGDMPYSGFLYGKAGFTTYEPDHTDSYELTVGTIGPAAQGKFVQRGIHDALDLYKPNGWDNYHLHNEPIVNVSYLRRHPGWASKEFSGWGNDWFADFEPRYGFAAGNAYDYVTTGGTVRFGPASARGADTPELTVPSMAGSALFAKNNSWFDWYVFATLDGRAVARNIFLDGNTFQSSPHVEKLPLVADGAVGLTLLTGPLKTSFTLNQSTKEFESQPHTDVFGAINVVYQF